MTAAHAADPTAHLGQFRDLVLFLATAGVVVPLFKRLKISPTLGYLVAGVALGPQGLGALAHRAPWLANLTVGKPEEVAQLAEFGVAFLLFTIGLELSWERLRSLRRTGVRPGRVAGGALLGGAGGRDRAGQPRLAGGDHPRRGPGAVLHRRGAARAGGARPRRRAERAGGVRGAAVPGLGWSRRC